MRQLSPTGMKVVTAIFGFLPAWIYNRFFPQGQRGSELCSCTLNFRKTGLTKVILSQWKSYEMLYFESDREVIA